ncbi:MAG: epoxyqueuosine reductase QueH [Candidatus Margulisiibacteriota bacterium]
MNKVLLHTCCAPCTTYVFNWLKKHEFEVSGFFYNPNIYPDEEYEKRKKCMEYYGAISGLRTTYVEEDNKPEAGNCRSCYEIRLRRTAKYGKENGFKFFTTTLLISPYQKHEVIKEIALRVAGEEGIEFLNHDFRDGYYMSRELSIKYNLYRQKYCGCLESLKAREEKYEQVA